MRGNKEFSDFDLDGDLIADSIDPDPNKPGGDDDHEGSESPNRAAYDFASKQNPVCQKPSGDLGP